MNRQYPLQQINNRTDLSRGSILVCKLPIFEHTGVYVGNGEVVELHGSGYIRRVNLYQFVRQGQQIFVACDSQGRELAQEQIAQNAEAQVGKYWGYNLIHNNCHRFTSGCVSGNYYNYNNMFWKLEEGMRMHYQLQGRIFWRPIPWHPF